MEAGRALCELWPAGLSSPTGELRRATLPRARAQPDRTCDYTQLVHKSLSSLACPCLPLQFTTWSENASSTGRSTLQQRTLTRFGGSSLHPRPRRRCCAAAASRRSACVCPSLPPAWTLQTRLSTCAALSHAATAPSRLLHRRWRRQRRLRRSLCPRRCARLRCHRCCRWRWPPHGRRVPAQLHPRPQQLQLSQHRCAWPRRRRCMSRCGRVCPLTNAAGWTRRQLQGTSRATQMRPLAWLHARRHRPAVHQRRCWRSRHPTRGF